MRPTLEVADIVRAHGEEFRQAHAASLSPRQKRALRNIELCRTAVLGGHLEQCDQCGHQRNAYNSCADRNCPKCQSLAPANYWQLPQMPVSCPGKMAGTAPGRTASGGVFPCGVHASGGPRP